MGIANHASRTSAKVFNAADLTLIVASGEPIQVCGIHFEAGTTADNVFTIANGAGTTLFVVRVLNDSSYNLDTPFLADAGLRVTSTQVDASVAVFHNSPGN